MPPSRPPRCWAGAKLIDREDHGDGMEEEDQDFEDLLHYLNLTFIT